MTTPHALLAFLIASSLLTITPGLDTALVLRCAALAGPKRAAAAAAGICLGLLTWGLAASIGLGELLKASALAYNVLRIAGACYLIFLGAKLFFRRATCSNPALDAATSDPLTTANSIPSDSPHRWFLRGLLTNILNPKVGIFYVTFLPLFIPAHVNVILFSLLLAGIHAFEGIIWFAVIIAAVRPLGRWLRNARVAETLDRLTGAIFVAFGLRLLLESRS
jgi:threonine/homoserine/homoserine lactone efflux protein